jgi:hypothetical protein
MIRQCAHEQNTCLWAAGAFRYRMLPVLPMRHAAQDGFNMEEQQLHGLNGPSNP